MVRKTIVNPYPSHSLSLNFRSGVHNSDTISFSGVIRFCGYLRTRVTHRPCIYYESLSISQCARSDGERTIHPMLTHGEVLAHPPTLSMLNRVCPERIARLKETRNRCKVYVLPEFVVDRKVEMRAPKKSCPNCGHHF